MPRSFVRFSRVAGSVLLVFALAAGSLQAQQWSQESQLMTVVKESDALDIFLDSLTAALEQNPETRVRRSPQDTSFVPYRTLSDSLLQEGLALISTTHIFIQYRFERKNSQIVETIEDLYFIYRERPEQEDISILHLSTKRSLVREVLIHGGVPSQVNMQTITPFRRFLTFPRLVQKDETTVVQMAGQPVRRDHERHRQSMVSYLDGFVKSRGIGYKLSTAQAP